MASYNTAKCYGLDRLGAVAPGYQADLVVLDDCEAVQIRSVYYRGKPIEQEEPSGGRVPEKLLDTVHIAYPKAEIFQMPLTKEEQPIIHVVPQEILTDFSFEKVSIKDGQFQPDETYQKIFVFERHHRTGMVGKGIVKGFSVKGGAIASTVGHDSHNLMVIGDDDEAMEQALLELIKCHGGYTVVKKGMQPLTQPLEIMGLMTASPHGEVAANLKNMIELARSMGIPKEIDPFVTLSFLALPVIPKVRITPMGIYDVEENCWYQVQ